MDVDLCIYVKAVLLKMCSVKSGFSGKTVLGHVHLFPFLKILNSY